MNVKKVFVFVLLAFLLINAVSATELAQQKIALQEMIPASLLSNH